MKKLFRVVWIGILLLPITGFGTTIPGLYFGHFGGSSQGAWMALVRKDHTGFMVAFDATYQQAFFETFQVEPDGFVSFWVSGSGWVEGNLSSSQVSGFAGSGQVSFFGERLEDTGPFLADAGVYFGDTSGSFSGQALVILTPSGMLFFFASNEQYFDGGYGEANLNGTYSMTSIFGNTFSGSLELGSQSLSGTFSGEGLSGEFSLDKVENQPIRKIWDHSRSIAENWYMDWIGIFYSENRLEGWIFHESLDWIYAVVADDGESTWIYLNDLGWIWTGSEFYPYGWSPTHGWLYYEDSSADLPRFYVFNQSNWITLN